jgi:hypothetical protein
MPARVKSQPPTKWYIADRPLPVGLEMGGETMPPRAFNAGDKVPAEHVEKFGWQQYVHHPSDNGGTPAGKE